MFKRAFVIGSALALSGCANWNTVYHEVSGSPDRQRSIVVDATQRSVVSIRKPALDVSGASIRYSNNEPAFSPFRP